MKDPQAILVLRFSSIGDIVLATSPLTTLRKRFPEARIDFMVLNHFAPLLENHPYVDRIIKINQSSNISTLKEIGDLANEDYDLVVDLHNSLRSKLIRKRITEPPTLIYKKPRWKRLKLIQFHINHFKADFNQRKLYHQCLKPILNGSNETPDSFLYVSENEKKQAIDLLRQPGLTGNFVVIIPGAAWESKRWQVEKYRTIVNELLQQPKLSVVVMGGKNDSICDGISIQSERVINLKNKTSIRQALGIISQAQFTLGSDTGLTHAAEALDVPSIVIMGPTSRETGGGTFRHRSTTIENSDLWCRPCSQNGKNPCYRKEQYCMTSITPDLVMTSIQQVTATL